MTMNATVANLIMPTPMTVQGETAPGSGHAAAAGASGKPAGAGANLQAGIKTSRQATVGEGAKFSRDPSRHRPASKKAKAAQAADEAGLSDLSATAAVSGPVAPSRFEAILQAARSFASSGDAVIVGQKAAARPGGPINGVASRPTLEAGGGQIARGFINAGLSISRGGTAEAVAPAAAPARHAVATTEGEVQKESAAPAVNLVGGKASFSVQHAGEARTAIAAGVTVQAMQKDAPAVDVPSPQSRTAGSYIEGSLVRPGEAPSGTVRAGVSEASGEDLFISARRTSQAVKTVQAASSAKAEVAFARRGQRGLGAKAAETAGGKGGESARLEAQTILVRSDPVLGSTEQIQGHGETSAVQPGKVPDQPAPGSMVDQIARVLRAGAASRNQQVVIRLDPPELGMVRVTLHADGKEVNSSVEVEHPRTLIELQREAPALLRNLAEAGIHIRSMNMSLSENNSGGSSGESQFGDQAGAWQGQPDQQGRDYSRGEPQLSDYVSLPAEPAVQQTSWVREDSINVWI